MEKRRPGEFFQHRLKEEEETEEEIEEEEEEDDDDELENGENGFKPKEFGLGKKKKRNSEGLSVSFLRRLEELQNFKDKFGHVNPDKYSSLGVWCSSQRVKHNKGRLTRQEIEALDDIGFDWNPSRQKSTQQRIQDLIEFQQVHGKGKLPIYYRTLKTKDKKLMSLARWIATLRSSTRCGHLSRKDIATLEELGVPMDKAKQAQKWMIDK